MKRVGIVTDRKRFSKMGEFIQELRAAALVEVRISEDLVLDFTTPVWDVDIIMAKANDPVSLCYLKSLSSTGVKIINPPDVIFNVDHRFIMNSIMKLKGIPQPDFAISIKDKNPFYRTIIKNYSYLVKHTHDLRLRIGKGYDEVIGDYRYYQRYIEPFEEFKIYSVGSEFMVYQVDPPVVFNTFDYHRNKRSFMTPVHEDKVIALSSKVVNIIGIKMCSMDIIRDENGNLHLVDLNLCPGFQINEVRDLLIEYLTEVVQ